MKSYPYSSLKCLIFTNPPLPHQKMIFLCNAREWISPATVTFILRELVTNPVYSHLVDMFHWIIIPVLNPDGYVYTHTKV